MTKPLIKDRKSGHWYDCRGPEAKASHDSDLRDARKHGLYPSVTTIDKAVFPNHFLDSWIRDQLAIAAFSNQPFHNETEKTYANRIHEISRKKCDEASDFGTKFHALLDNFPAIPDELELRPFRDCLGKWIDAEVGEIKAREEIVFDDHLGVAGRFDLCYAHRQDPGVERIADIKTQDVKRNEKGEKKAKFYDSWIRQLAFYAVARSKLTRTFPTIPPCDSVVFDSNEPGVPFVKRWPETAVKAAYNEFVAGCWLYFVSRGFWPGKQGKWSPWANSPPVFL